MANTKKKLSLSSVIAFTSALTTGLSAIMLLIITVLVVADTLLRYVFSAPTKWGMETTQYLTVSSIFLAGGGALLHGTHVRIKVIYDHLAARGRIYLDILACIAVAILSGMICWDGAWLTQDAIARWTLYLSPVRIPMFPAYLFLAAGSFFLSLQALALLVGYIRALRSKQAKVEAQPEETLI